MTSIIALSGVAARPEHIDALVALVALVASHRDLTLTEPGCIGYRFVQNRADPSSFLFIEEWDSKENFESHLKQQHVKTMVDAGTPYVQSISSTNIYRIPS